MRSNGTALSCSFCDPGLMHMEIGIPLLHEQSHLDNGRGAVFLAGTIFPQSAENLTGDRINVGIVFMFAFKEIIGTIVITDGSVPLHHVIAVHKQMFHVGVEIVHQNIQVTKNMVVVKSVFHTVIRIQPVICSGLGAGIQDSSVCQEPVNVVAGKGDLPIRQYLGKELFQMQIMIDLLERKITDILQLGFGGNIPGSNELLFEVDLELKLNFSLFHLLIEQPDLLLCV